MLVPLEKPSRDVNFGGLDPDLDHVQKATAEGYKLVHKAIAYYVSALRKAETYYKRRPANDYARELIGRLRKLNEELSESSFYTKEVAADLGKTITNAPKYDTEK